ISCTDQLAPATPLLLLAHAPMIPATCVPWPLSSSPDSPDTKLLMMGDWQDTMSSCPVRSGKYGQLGSPTSMPVSTTATRADPLPLVPCHGPYAFNVPQAHCITHPCGDLC